MQFLHLYWKWKLLLEGNRTSRDSTSPTQELRNACKRYESNKTAYENPKVIIQATKQRLPRRFAINLQNQIIAVFVMSLFETEIFLWVLPLFL